jgi:alpha 1,3-glucosidase
MKERYNGKQRPFILTRSYFAGSQTLGAMWTGDNAAKWEFLKASISMILTQNIVGMPFSGADVGGFFGNPSSELLARWYQAAVFYPFFRGHAHIDTKRREPWIPPAPYSKVIADALKLRYNLLPTIYTAFRRSSVDGTPVIQPMFYMHPNNDKTYSIDDQFYLSTSGIMAKPVTDEGLNAVELYIPDQQPYYDMQTFDIVRGEGLHVVAAPLEKIPMYLRGGHIIPRRERMRRSSSLMKNDPYTLYVAVDEAQSAHGEIYVDDYVSYEFENGAYAHTNFDYDNGVITSTPTHSDDGSYATIPVERIVLLGVRHQYTTATITADTTGTTSSAQILRGPNGSQIVRNPRVPVAGSWTITLS